MTFAERRAAVAELGFTERQAGFLVHVLLHAGVCLARQYCTYAGIVRGQKVQDFFQALVDRRYATPHPCARHTAWLYHLHHVRLYEAIGERDSRLRKPAVLAHAVERLMILDHVLAEPTLTWLATERDKVAYFLLTTPLRHNELPRRQFGRGAHQTSRYFPERLPIGISPDQRHHLFLYLVTDPTAWDFRAFLNRHAELFRALPAWTVRLLAPRGMTNALQACRSAFAEEFARPLPPRMRDDLLWYYRARTGAEPPDAARLSWARRTFGAPRYRALFRIWQELGDRVVDATVSTALPEALEHGSGRLECCELTHDYLHLGHLVGTA